VNHTRGENSNRHFSEVELILVKGGSGHWGLGLEGERKEMLKPAQLEHSSDLLDWD